MDDERWSSIERELRREARPNPVLVGRIVRAVEPAPAAGAVDRLSRWLRRPISLTLTPMHAGGVCAAALVLVLALRLAGSPPTLPPVLVQGPAALSAVEAVQPVQFVWIDDGAREVSLVGDFNDWDPARTPMRRTEAEGVWSVVVALEHGRYLYAFIVDGSWVADAMAPRGPDSGFGAHNSVVLVGEGL